MATAMPVFFRFESARVLPDGFPAAPKLIRRKRNSNKDLH